jgi:hypothetical protein
VKLTVDGKDLNEPLTVRMDPRSIATPAELNQHFTWAQKVYKSLVEVDKAIAHLTPLASQPRAKALLAGLQSLARSLNGILSALESADRTPPSQVIAAYQDVAQRLTLRLSEASQLKSPQ